MIAVTGANGLLGSFIVRKLIQQNEPFVALKRKGSDTSLLNDVADRIKWSEVDVLDVVSLNDAFKNVTHVIHSAAIVSFNPRKATQVMEINVVGTRNVVNACLTNGVQRIIHVSSVAALGAHKGQVNIDEENKWIDSFYHSVYAKSKYMSELEIFRGQEEGLSSVVVNPSLILAEANWNISSAQIFKYVWGQKPFYTAGSLNYVDVLDVASIVCSLLRSTIEGERFILSAGTISFKELFDRIAREFKKKSPSIRINKSFLRVGARLETWRSIVTGSEPKLTRETVRITGTNFRFENRKISKRLDFEFQPIDRTLQRCCRYYIDKMNHKK